MDIQNNNNTKDVIDPYEGVIIYPVIPVASDDRRCIAWSCGGIVCAIVSCISICIVFLNSDFVDAVNAQDEAFNQFNNGDDFYGANIMGWMTHPTMVTQTM